MANAYSGQQNGLSNDGESHDSRNHVTRPFTLQEALPYSPQTSILPFTPDLIPDPIIGSGSLGAGLTDLFTRDEFDTVNRSGDAQTPNRKHIKQVADILLQEIKPKERTAYKFKLIPRVTGAMGAERNPAEGLSPLAKTLFDRVSKNFTYAGQDATGSSKMNGRPQSSSRKSSSTIKVETPTITPSKTTNTQSVAQNRAKIEVAIPLKKPININDYIEFDDAGAPSQSEQPMSIDPAKLQAALQPSQTQQEQPVAHVPDTATINPSDLQILPPPTITPIKPPPMPTVTPVPAPVPASQPASVPSPMADSTPKPSDKPKITVELSTSILNKDEYVDVPDSPDAPTQLSAKKRKRDELLDGDGLLGTSLDQRQRGDAALQDLMKITYEVFSAVGQALSGDTGVGHLVVLNESNEPTLTAPMHQKVQSAIQKVISLGVYDQMPIEDLVRYQKLCEGSIKDTGNLELKIDDTWGEPEIAQWIYRIPEIETALKAARTALRIMSGEREDKRLYSEETIQQCLDLFKRVMDGIVVPIVELRNSGPPGVLFKLLMPHKKALAPIFTNGQRLFALLATLVTSIELSESVINTLEFLATQLLFVENAHYEKDSVIGVQRFDGLRLVAMDMLCQIFLMNPGQRQGIFDEILTSLEKLPIGKQSARHFKLADGGSIQPVSALIMRLVQVSAGKVDEGKERKKNVLQDSDNEGADNEQSQESGSGGRIMYMVKTEEDGCEQFNIAIKELGDTVTPLVETTKRNASYVVGFIINRALKSTKSGDTPYRNLLDLFVEDFTTCLDSPDWPAAELLLRFMMIRMVQLSEGEKTAAPAKNMALDVLGTMGAAISRLRSTVRKAASTLDSGDSDELGRFLAGLAISALEQRARTEYAVSWSGPYRVTLEHLEERCSNDPHLRGAISLVMSDWANKICTGFESLEGEEQERDMEFGRLAYRLRMMLDDRRWMSNEYTFKTVSPTHTKLAYAVVLLRSQLCESFNIILNIVLGAMASDQATVRSKSLKSVNQVLETDPAILDGDSIVIQLILQCSSDSSPQVRDSALGLIGKCMSMRPHLEEQLTPRVVDRFMDAGIGARKRAMKLARDIYLRNKNRSIRVAIASGLLLRVQDPDEGVRDLARQMIEEIWFAPFYNNAEDTPAFQASLTDHVSLMVQVSKMGHAAAVLDKVLQSILGPHTKLAEGPLAVCTKLVATMFELINTLDSDDPSIPSGRDALQVLMTFAKAEPKLFTFEQIKLLKPHLSNFTTVEDLHVFRATVVIYRRVLPQLSAVHTQFFMEVRTQLLGSIAKISKVLLDDVVACVWIVCGILNAITPLARLALSSLVGIQKLRQVPLNAQNIKVFQRYSVIVGMIGKHCDLDSQMDLFKEKFPKWKGKTVPSLMVDCLLPFAAPDRPEDARKAALDAVGLVCQSWPRTYVSPNVYTTFQQVFDEKIPALEDMILSSFKEFLFNEEKRSEAASAAASGNGEGEKKRELTVMGGTNYDDVASATTQRFLKELTRISLTSQDDHAFLAIEVLGSINRQGLVHPKETGVTLITLQTSSYPKIAEIAYQEYKALHEKHETVLEREYAKAVQSAFAYQRDIAKDTRGATANPFQAKLHLLMEILKISKSKNRQKFLERLCQQIDFDFTKLDIRQAPPYHVAFSRFIIENLAFFEYVTIGEVLTTVASMEKIVSGTGAAIAHIIETEVFNVRMDVDSAPAPPPSGPDGQADGMLMQPTPPKLNIDQKRFRQLAAGAVILLSMWEARTYLRRLYGLGTQRRDPKAKAAAKDMSKSPVKVQGITGDKFWEEVTSHMAGLDSQEAMFRKCRAFVDLLNVDHEFKVAEEDEEMDGDMAGTPSGDEDDGIAPERGRKRKGTGTPGGRKKRARSTSRPRARGRPRKQSMDADADGDAEPDWF
ncbi:hypothetical protein jhhlp_005908 [Lomentospora prolificans]|uniref:Sister chromatid cohesion protein n=1 Tax=Lomentospora prolificans TaxID=41688 RepID=A0A2N3N4F5_9PEZI|nr:hypothetical protein jhhlp_005908 [Lomentospora prolificans]